MEKVIEIKITVDYKVRGMSGSNQFNTLQELKYWCDKNPELAKAIGYTKGMK